VPRYKLTIGYDGTDFHGWQTQLVTTELAVERSDMRGAVADAGSRTFPRVHESGRVELRTVQSVVQQAVREVVREVVEVKGASRTDAGVHARGQVAAFTCTGEGGGRGWPAERGTGPLVRAINSRLPDDVLVVGAEIVADAFEPISDCVSKGYSYTMHVAPDRGLWDRRYATHVWVPLDVEAMRAAALRIVGRHDFASFAATGHGRENTVRTVFGCEVSSDEATERRRDGSERHKGTEAQRHGAGDRSRGLSRSEWGEGRRVRIEVSGDGFLYNMVRIIAGTLVEVGRGRIAPDAIEGIIAGRDRRLAGPTMAPTGLCLEWVSYEARA
jgi:tRNA pseudouridine38-40 synthase